MWPLPWKIKVINLLFPVNLVMQTKKLEKQKATSYSKWKKLLVFLPKTENQMLKKEKPQQTTENRNFSVQNRPKNWPIWP